MKSENNYTNKPMRSWFRTRADYDKAVLDYESNKPETEEDGIKAEVIRRLKVRKLSKGPLDPISR